jgi:hypothetical protein
LTNKKLVKMAMRGLTQFIGDIRNCTNKEEERKRVDKEMANIRCTPDMHRTSPARPSN